MKHTFSLKHIAFGMVIALCLTWLNPTQAQTVSGQISNSSIWHEDIQGPPGDGDGQGNLTLGIWNMADGIFAVPVSTTIITNGALPFLNGPYSFIIGVSSGDYVTAAWIDGNMNGLLDMGEPYGKAEITISTTSVTGVSMDVSDYVYDGDTMPDWWEYHWFRFTKEPFGPSSATANSFKNSSSQQPSTKASTGIDTDKDGISDEDEYLLSVKFPDRFGQLSPINWDSDGDFIDDHWEAKYYSEEFDFGIYPLDFSDAIIADADLDGDGLSNWQEYCGVDGYPLMRGLTNSVNGIWEGITVPVKADDLNPLDIDTDFDLLIDSFEAAWYDPNNGIDPVAGPLKEFPSATNINTEVARADSDQDGLSNYREQCLLSQLQENSANGEKWVWEGRVPFPMSEYFDRNSEHIRICYMSAVTNLFVQDHNKDLKLNLDPNINIPGNRDALRANSWTDPTDGTGYTYVDENIPPGHDSDNDGLPDGWEVEFNLAPRSSVGDHGKFGDLDRDGLWNILEYLGQDGNRSTTRPYVNGTGDETNPNEYNHRPDSTYNWRWNPTNIDVNPLTDPRIGTGISRIETMGSARPTRPLSSNIADCVDNGQDSDDDGKIDSEEMFPPEGRQKSSPVHSCDPFEPKSILITSSNGIDIPDPEPATANGDAPAGFREDLQRRDWTLECYVKLLGNNLTGDLMNFRTIAFNSTPIVYQLALSNNVPSIVFQLNKSLPVQSVSANSLPTNEWIHLAAVWNHANNSLSLYINGILGISIANLNENFGRFMFPATNRLALAVSPNGSFTNRLMLDEVRIWGVPRTPSQIATYANRLVPPHNGDDVWLDKIGNLGEYYAFNSNVLVNGGSLFDGEPSVPLANVYKNGNNYWIDNGDKQYNSDRDTILYRDETLNEGILGILIGNARWNDKDGDGVFSRESLLAYYRFDDSGSTAEDFARRAKSGLLGSTSEEYQFGDQGYALPTNNFTWVTNDVPPIYGVDKRGADDSDGDGMPDAWEMVWHLDPWDNGAKNESAPGMRDGPGGPKGDPDHDGLQNIYEYWSGTNPKSNGSDGNSAFDSEEDHDRDGVNNITEQQLRSRPDMIDTDDDGTPDNDEQSMGSSPAEPTDPSTNRAVVLGGSPNDYLQVPISTNQRLADWTIEAWVNPSNAVDGAGIIIRRAVQNLPNGILAVNYIMGLETNGSSLRLYAGYIRPNGISSNILYGGMVPATGSWTHVAARYNSSAGELNLYTNGGLASTTNTFTTGPSVSGKGGDTFLRIGEGFAGGLDEIRLWKAVRTENQIRDGKDKVIPNSDMSSLVHYFRFDDGEADTNRFAWGEFHQPGGFQDFTYTSDWNEQWRHAARTNGNVSIISPGAIVPPPTLRVMLFPEAARVAGAQWTAGREGIWFNSGETIQGLAPGEHSIAYKSILGWLEPSPETIILVNGVATNLFRNYLQRSHLTVNIEPLEVRATGLAFWRVDGPTCPWQQSGGTVSNLTPGSHTLEFSSVPGWVAPPTTSVNLNPGQSLTITDARSLYTVMRGSIRTFLSPAPSAARWRINGETNWLISGDSATNLALTTNIIHFSSVAYWTTPASIPVNITNEQPVTVTGSYTQISGIRVDIEPEEVSETARWSYNNITWTNSGAFIELGTGSYTVSFSDVPGWVTPNPVHTVISQAVSIIQGTYYRFDIIGGSPGSRPGQFVNPRSVAIDAQHNLYVSDSQNNRIQKGDALSTNWMILGTGGTAKGQFAAPEGITVDANGNVFVADAGNSRIQKLVAASGQWTNPWGSFGSSVGYFKSPMDVAVDSDGYLYVADRDNNRVQKLSTNGITWSIFINSGNSDGLVTSPKGLFVDSSDNLYVSDDGTQTNGSSRIQKFSKTGTLIGILGSRQQGQLKRPGGMTIGLTNLYVADIDNSRVAASSTNAIWNTIIGSNILNHAEDVAWDPRGFLLIADTDNNRILRLPVIPGVETNLTPSFTATSMNPGSKAAIDQGTATNSRFTLTWYGILNWYYAVEYANTLNEPWMILPGSTNIQGNNALTNCTDYSVGSVSSRFYRIIAY